MEAQDTLCIVHARQLNGTMAHNNTHATWSIYVWPTIIIISAAATNPA